MCSSKLSLREVERHRLVWLMITGIHRHRRDRHSVCFTHNPHSLHFTGGGQRLDLAKKKRKKWSGPSHPASDGFAWVEFALRGEDINSPGLPAQYAHLVFDQTELDTLTIPYSMFIWYLHQL